MMPYEMETRSSSYFVMTWARKKKRRQLATLCITMVHAHMWKIFLHILLFMQRSIKLEVKSCDTSSYFHILNLKGNIEIFIVSWCIMQVLNTLILNIVSSSQLSPKFFFYEAISFGIVSFTMFFLHVMSDKEKKARHLTHASLILSSCECNHARIWLSIVIMACLQKTGLASTETTGVVFCCAPSLLSTSHRLMWHDVS